jgi:hypothetical protein
VPVADAVSVRIGLAQVSVLEATPKRVVATKLALPGGLVFWLMDTLVVLLQPDVVLVTVTE